MKTLIAATVITLSLSGAAFATPCAVIAKTVADQFVTSAQLANSSSEQRAAYEDLVNAHLASCRNGVNSRNKGITPDQIVMITQAVKDPQGLTAMHVVAHTMTAVSFAQGYAYGE